MTSPDRTDELVLAMLERRAGGPVPAWLHGTVMGRVVTAGRRRRGIRGLGSGPLGAGRRRALVAVVVLPLGVLAGAALAVGFLELTGAAAPARRAVVTVPSPGPSLVAAATDPPATSPPSPGPTPRVLPATLGPDIMAVVTGAGARLRVRTAPGTGSDSVMLNPVLPAGARMVVLSGPVAADGYDWYEVVTQGNAGPRYGWVASGKDGEVWIEPTLPDCPDNLDARAVVSLDPLDFLLCYGDREVPVQARSLEPSPGSTASCPWTRAREDCSMIPTWMGRPTWLTIAIDGETVDGTDVAVPSALEPDLAALSEGAPLTVTLAADTPDAASCRIVDAGGHDVVPPTRAVLECRLMLVVRGVAPATAAP